MNNLSWFIYGVEVTDNVKLFLNITGGLVFFFGLVGLAVHVMWTRSYETSPEDTFKPFKPLGWIWALGLAAILLNMVVPSGQTLKYIAASEFGERVLTSERVQGIVDPGLQYVEKWLKDAVKEK